jgi:hypothetical protein
MDAMSFKLRREVEPPQRQNTGLGVMLIASAAMFFAVAGSAFILRARMASSCCVRVRTAAPASVEAPSAREPASTSSIVARPSAQPFAHIDNCGQAVYRNNPDGSVSVYFDLCPPDPAPAVGGAEGVQVIRIAGE